MVFFAILCISIVAQVLCQPTIRDTLLCEARQRLNQWYEGGAKPLGSAYRRDGVELHFVEGVELCNGNPTPVMFANFTLEGVQPIHLFNALADIERQQEWYEKLRSVKVLSDSSFHARGARLQYIAGAPLPDRLVHEWEAYAKNKDGSEYWFVASTNQNDIVKAMDKKEQESGIEGLFDWNQPVEAQNCLSAHRFRATPTGVYVVFTNQVNGHPPLGIPQDLVSKLTWGKTIDFVDLLKKRALTLAKQDSTTLWKPPVSMMAEQESSAAQACEPMWDELRKSLKLRNGLQEKDEVTDVRAVMLSTFVDHKYVFVAAAGAGCILFCVAVLVFVVRRFQAHRLRKHLPEFARSTQEPYDAMMTQASLIHDQPSSEYEINA